jgi:phosphoglucosamine mutase
LKREKTRRLFGTDGIRGEAGKFPLDPSTVRVAGESLARHLAECTGRQHPRIIIGRDTRESGRWIEGELIEGARAFGAEIQSAGIITTPGVAFLARTLPADAGVVISASHNPYDDNGIKVFDPSGRKLDEATERKIENDLWDCEPRASNATAANTAEDPISAALRSQYLEYLTHDVGIGLSLAGLTIAIDCANGAAYQLAPELFRRLGAQVIPMNDKPDGQNINRDCGSQHIEGLQHRVIEQRADFGVAFDGDADRALFVDGAGQFVDGDATMWVMANYLRKRGELAGGVVVATVMSNIGLEIALRARGIRLVRTDVGDKYVLEELIRTGAVLGGEQSGHIIFPKLSLAGDGLITALVLLRAIRDEQQTLAELTREFRRYPQILVNVRVQEKRPFTEMPRTSQLAQETEAKLAQKGRLLLRYSGTEPLARIMIEGEDEDSVRAWADSLAEAIRADVGAGEPS